MNKTPEEREAAAQRRVEVMIQNLKEGVARDKPITDKIIEELDRKHALKMIPEENIPMSHNMEQTEEEWWKDHLKGIHKAIMSAFGPQHAKTSSQSSEMQSPEKSPPEENPLPTKSFPDPPEKVRNSGVS